MTVLLVSLLMALMAGRPVVDDEAWAGVSQWMGLVYLGFAFKLLFPGTGMAHTQNGTAAIGRNALVLLIAFAIIVRFSCHLPELFFRSCHGRLILMYLFCRARICANLRRIRP